MAHIPPLSLNDPPSPEHSQRIQQRDRAVSFEKRISNGSTGSNGSNGSQTKLRSVNETSSFKRNESREGSVTPRNTYANSPASLPQPAGSPAFRTRLRRESSFTATVPKTGRVPSFANLTDLVGVVGEPDINSNEGEGGYENGDSSRTAYDWQLTRVHAVAEMNFLASIGDLERFKRTVLLSGLKVDDPSTATVDARTPLHIAAEFGSYSIVEWLVSKNAPINAMDSSGMTPLYCAARQNHTLVVAILDANGGRVAKSLRRGDLTLVAISEGTVRGKMDIELPDGMMDKWQLPRSDIQLGKLIGEGQFGSVFHSMWHGTEVAVKKLKLTILESPEGRTALQEFRGEINLIHTLHHPHIVQFLGVVHEGNNPMVVTEVMPMSLETVFTKPTAFGNRLATERCLDLARGLAYLHGLTPKPILHRDLKPANIMISLAGRIKLTDFGLSKTHQSADPYKMTGETGSYRYMAPEVFKHLPYDKSVDIYAFAFVMYQCYTWQRPLDGFNGADAARAACDGIRPTVHTVPKPLQDVLHAMWHESAISRPEILSVLTSLELYKETLAVASQKSGFSLKNINFSFSRPKVPNLDLPASRSNSQSLSTTVITSPGPASLSNIKSEIVADDESSDAQNHASAQAQAPACGCAVM